MQKFIVAFLFIVLSACAKDSEYSGTDASFASLSVANLTVGEYHSCATTNYGSFCWGSNFMNELGDGTYAHKAYPVLALDGAAFTGLSAGNAYNCALSGGGVKCWGSNFYGSLGTSSVPSILSVSCGVTTTCSSEEPVDVENVGGGGELSDVTQVSAGRSFACARTSAGAAVCWGYNNDGQLGNGGTVTSAVPVAVTGLNTNVEAVAAGQQHACAIVSGAVKCWGYNGSGQLGDNTTNNSSTPVAANVLTSGVTAIDVGQLHSCAIKDGAAYCWGSNDIGQLGDGTMVDRNVPTQVAGLTSGVTAISVGSSFTCAIHNQALKCWGYNISGQVGNGTSGVLVSSPVQVTDLDSDVTAVSAGYMHACAVQGKKLFCWGDNSYGQLGSGNNVFSTSPVEVVNPVLEM